jgi:hypothetical protein
MKMKPSGTVAILVAACVASLGSAAWACGDKLVALGGGVGFERVMVSRNPSHILLMLEPATGLAAANERFNLVGSLSLAGHEVFIARNADELREQRLKAAPVLILIDAARAKELQFRPVANDGEPMIMPVVYVADPGAAAAESSQSGCVAIAGGRKGSQLLKAVENALKLRSRGLPMACDQEADSQRA